MSVPASALGLALDQSGRCGLACPVRHATPCTLIPMYPNPYVPRSLGTHVRIQWTHPVLKKLAHMCMEEKACVAKQMRPRPHPSLTGRQSRTTYGDRTHGNGMQDAGWLFYLAGERPSGRLTPGRNGLHATLPPHCEGFGAVPQIGNCLLAHNSIHNKG